MKQSKITKMTIKQFSFLILLISLTSFSQNGPKNFIDQPFLDVTGTVETEISPDEIYVKITLNENDKRGKVSIEKQEHDMVKQLKSLDIDTDNCLSVLEFDGYYQRKFLSENEVVKIKSYQLIVTNGKTLSEVYKVLDDINISNLSIIKISHSEIEKIKRDTKIKAVKAAKLKAEDFAEALGQTIGKAIFIQELNDSQVQNINHANQINIRGYGSKAQESYLENIGVQKITIKSSIQVKFILK